MTKKPLSDRNAINISISIWFNQRISSIVGRKCVCVCAGHWFQVCWAERLNFINSIRIHISIDNRWPYRLAAIPWFETNFPEEKKKIKEQKQNWEKQRIERVNFIVIHVQHKSLAIFQLKSIVPLCWRTPPLNNDKIVQNLLNEWN